MILCLCEGLSDRVVEGVIAEGARTVRDVERECGAGGDCRRCCKAIRSMIRRRQPTQRD